MDFTVFDQARIRHIFNASPQQGVYPSEFNEQLALEDFQLAKEVISTWDGYEASPLESLKSLANEIDVADIYYKDEAYRFQLESFKALGGAYAVLRLVKRELEIALNQNQVTLGDY